MESEAIAAALDKKFPEPSLHMDSPILVWVKELMPRVWTPLIPLLINSLPTRVLPPRSQAYYDENRSTREGVSLAQIEKERGGDIAWHGAKEPLQELDALLRANGGPFLIGSEGKLLSFFLLCRTIKGHTYGCSEVGNREGWPHRRPA